MFKTISI